MGSLIIKRAEDGTRTECACCARELVLCAGPHLFALDGDRAVCQSCGRRGDPGLAALVELGRAAIRVGKVSQHSHSLWVPMERMLSLAQAAHHYTATLETRESA